MGADPAAADADEMGLEDIDPRRKRGGVSVASKPAFRVDGGVFSYQSHHRPDFRRPWSAGDRPACHGADVSVGKIAVSRADARNAEFKMQNAKLRYFLRK